MSLDARVNNFFSFKPCDFEGCDKLRDEYLMALEEKRAEGGCFECRKGQVIRKFVGKVRAAIRNSVN